MNNGDELAFSFVGDKNYGIEPSSGLTKREYFAAMAMQGFVSCAEAMNQLRLIEERSDKNQSEMIAMISLGFADALLKELEK